MRQLLAEFARQGGPDGKYTGGGTSNGIKALCEGKADVAVIGADVGDESKALLAQAFPDPKRQPKEQIFSQTALIFIVNPRNPVASLTVDQLKAIALQEATRWSKVGGSGGLVTLYGPGIVTNSTSLLRKHILGGARWQTTGVVMCGNSAEVIARVAKDPAGIGYITARMDDESLKSVKCLGVVLAAGKPAVQPTRANMLTETYPFVVKIKFLIHPDAPPAAHEFCRFACSDKMADLTHKWGFFPVSEREREMGNKRLADLREQKGAPVNMAGAALGRGFVSSLVTNYAHAELTVKPSYIPADSDIASIRLMTSTENRAEILLLSDRPRDEAINAVDKQWEGLNPKEYVIGGRAVAVVVNKQVKADSLTMAQVRSIFTGEIDNWKLLGGADAKVKLYGVRPATGNELSSYSTADLADLALMEMDRRQDAGGTGGQDARLTRARTGDVTAAAARDAKLARYASAQAGYRDGQAAEVFYKEVAPSAKVKGMTYCKTTAEVLSAVAMDENAIGFVNYTDLLAAGGELQKDLAVKVLAVGPAGRAVGPSADTIKNAMYPLSQRLYLYVHPQASDIAKDFAKFIATCGQSTTNPYTDVPKSVGETFRKLGLVNFAPVMAVPSVSSGAPIGKSISATAPAAAAAGMP